MNKLRKLINMAFHGKEYDDMKGWGKILIVITLPLFLLMQVIPMFVPTKADRVEFAIIIGSILAVVVVVCYLIGNIIISLNL